jgi:hypothetical protein
MLPGVDGINRVFNAETKTHPIGSDPFLAGIFLELSAKI